MKKIFLIFLIMLAIIVIDPLNVRAENTSVTLVATVVKKKSTDTINDFDFSKINPNNNRVIAMENERGRVLGTNLKKDNYLSRILSFIYSIF